MSGEAKIFEKSAEMRETLAQAKWLGLDRVSEHAHALTFLLCAMEWKGQIGQLCEALPHMPGELDDIDLVNTMVNLGYHAKSTSLDIHNFDARLAPCLFVTQENGKFSQVPFVLLDAPELQGAKAYDALKNAIVPLEDIANLSGTLYVLRVHQG